MATLGQVEKLREKANVSYDEARAALDACNDDLLEAIIYLEKQGKVSAPTGDGFYSSRQEQPAAGKGAEGATEDPAAAGESLGKLVRRLCNWLGRVLHRGNVNSFEVWQKENRIAAIPITVLVILLVVGFWVVVPLMVVGLFLGCRYRFNGPDMAKSGVNSVMDSAARAADSFKQEVIRSEEEDRQ